MCTSESPRHLYNEIHPQPGEIWEIKRNPQIPIEFNVFDTDNLYSDVARRYLAGDYPEKYVMIVTEPESMSSSFVEEVGIWQIIDVMVLSEETNFVSDVDLLIPTKISGFERDLLAETWLVESMLVCNLLQPTGKRLARQVYDILLNVHDNFHGLCSEFPTQSEIQSLGMKSKKSNALESKSINIFHHRETAWSDILTVPIAFSRKYLQSVKLTEDILDEATRLSQDLEKIELPENHLLETVSSSIYQARVVLSRWLENIIDAEWEIVTQIPEFAVATRSLNHQQKIPSIDEIPTLIQQLSFESEEYQRRRIAKRLSEIAAGNSDGIQALVNLLQTTQDDETLWTAVESLWQIDPGHPAGGVRRVKLVVGIQLAGEGVALAVALVSKVNQRVGVLIQVYPTERETYLPSELQLMLLDTSGNLLRIVKARLADIYVQLKFSGEIGEQFSIRVALGEAQITENFII